jgi:hypothetical protein
MRKPRDIDAELAALAERTSALKARRVMQLGELVGATGADTLDPDTLAGALLAMAAEQDGATRAAWKRDGERFFRGEHKAADKPHRNRQTAGQTPGAEAAG